MQEIVVENFRQQFFFFSMAMIFNRSCKKKCCSDSGEYNREMCMQMQYGWRLSLKWL